MVNRTFDLRNNMDEILNEISSVSPKLISEQIDRFERESNLSTAINMINIQEEHGIELTKYCSKTGQQIGVYSVTEFQQMQKILPISKIQFYIERRSIEYVASHWIFTDGESLEKLSEFDPYGYMIYGITSMFGYYQRFLKKQNPTDDISFKGKRQWLDHKIQAYKQISSIPLSTIFEANELIRRYLTIVQTAKAYNLVKWKHTDIREITHGEARLRHLITEIRRNLERIIRHEYRAKRLKTHISYADVVGLKNIFIGHTNFRRQRKPKELTEVEMIMEEIGEFLPPEHRMAILVGDRYEKPKKTKPVEQKGKLKLKISSTTAKPKMTLAEAFGKKG